MRNFDIYLAGAMACCESFQEMNEWRANLTEHLYEVAQQCNDYFNTNINIKVTNPCNYYNLLNPVHQSELEVMKFDLARVGESDLIIVNLDKLNQSIGTSMELHEAWNRRIPVIGYDLNNEYQNIHPWLQCCITRVEKSKNDLLKYLIDFYFTY